MSQIAGTEAVSAQGQVDRASLVRLGTADSGWAFLGAGAQYLRDAGGDDEVRLLCARALAAVGLRGLAARTAERVNDAGLVAERDGMIAAGAGEGPIGVDELVGRARANLAVVDVDAEAAIAEWIGGGARYFAASDGNVVRCASGCDDLPSWDWVGDLRGMAASFCRQHLPDGATRAVGPVTVEGASPPWLLLALHEALPRLKDGYWPWLQIVQRDAAALAEGFALADLSAVLERSRAFAGEDAGERLSAFVRSRFDYPATGPVIPQPVALAVEPRIGELVRGLGAEQKARAMALHRELVRRDRGRDEAYWAARYAEDGRKRVLIPTCRYSTFIQHASRDLARAFEDAGWEARVLIEPDDQSRFSTIAYHRAELEFDPDLIVLINYPRAARADAFVTQTPFVCWIQDAMPHLFDERIGRGHGPRDFVFGHVYPKLFREFGYPAGRAAAAPVVASAKKFHDGWITREQADRYACDMAYVSHHSETPTAMHARLCAEAGDPAIVSVLHEMRKILGERYKEIVGEGGPEVAKSIPAQAWAKVHGTAATARSLGQFREQYLVPILERVVRHEMLEWAAQVADRRGWSLKIYGKGWEGHETLGRFAAGELAHGEDLRAAYQAAGVHLHASMTTLVHQRVMECALSGGLPVCRLIGPNLGASRQAALLSLIREGVEPDRVNGNGWLVFETGGHERLGQYGALLASVGMRTPEEVALHPSVAENMRRYPCGFDGCAAEELIGDLGTGTFRSAAQLESVVHRVLQRPELRRARSESIAARVRERFTHDAVATGMARLVRTTVRESQSGGRDRGTAA